MLDNELATMIDIMVDFTTGYIAGRTGKIVADSDHNLEIFKEIFLASAVNMTRKEFCELLDEYLDKDWEYEEE